MSASGSPSTINMCASAVIEFEADRHLACVVIAGGLGAGLFADGQERVVIITALDAERVGGRDERRQAKKNSHGQVSSQDVDKYKREIGLDQCCGSATGAGGLCGAR